jgi:hypothetical protein
MRHGPFLLFAAITEHALDDLEHLDHRVRGYLFRIASEMKSEFVEHLGQLGPQIRAEQLVIFAQLSVAANEGQARRNIPSISPTSQALLLAPQGRPHGGR